MEAFQMSSELKQKRAALEKMVSYAFKKGLLIRLADALVELGLDPENICTSAIRDEVISITGTHSTLVHFVCVCVCVCVVCVVCVCMHACKLWKKQLILSLCNIVAYVWLIIIIIFLFMHNHFFWIR